MEYFVFLAWKNTSLYNVPVTPEKSRKKDGKFNDSRLPGQTQPAQAKQRGRTDNHPSPQISSAGLVYSPLVSFFPRHVLQKKFFSLFLGGGGRGWGRFQSPEQKKKGKRAVGQNARRRGLAPRRGRFDGAPMTGRHCSWRDTCMCIETEGQTSQKRTGDRRRRMSTYGSWYSTSVCLIPVPRLRTL